MTALRETRGDGRKVLSREDIRIALRQYAALYGDDFPQSAFSPSQAKRNGREDLVERYYAGRTPGEPNSPPWISLNGIKSKYDGSWNAARADVGLPPNTTGPTEARPRRKPGEAEPILNVRERRIVVSDAASISWLRRELAKAERRSERLADALDAAEVRVVEVPIKNTREVNELRKRLSDERHRYKDVKRELHNAVRREARARATADRYSRAERADAAALREVDRLTQRLVEAQDENRELRGHRPAPKTVAKTKTKTVTKVVKDPVLMRTIERLETQVTDLRTSGARVEASRAELAERLAEIREDAIRAALKDRRVQTAERRTLVAEKAMAEMAEVLVGERRQLTDAELDALRRDGPAGERLFIDAVRKVGRAYGREARKKAIYNALVEGFNWMERL